MLKPGNHTFQTHSLHSFPAGIPTCNNGKTDGYVWTGHSHIPGTLNHSFPITVANTGMSSPVSVARIMKTLIISLRVVREIYSVGKFQDNKSFSGMSVNWDTYIHTKEPPNRERDISS